MSGWILTMTAEDISVQHQAQITDKIIKNIHRAKTFAVVTTAIEDTVIKVEMAVPSQDSELLDWISETTTLVYNKYSGDRSWVTNLYAALAYRINDSSVSISVLEGDRGWITKFN